MVSREEKRKLELVKGGGEKDEEGNEPVREVPKAARRRDKKRKQLLVEASRLYGTDFVPKLESIRDPKERIIFVAESIFASKGFAGARTQEIADLAAVNKAMIHYYFDSKEKLYHALLDKILFDLIKLTQETVSDDLGYPEQLEAFCRGFFDYVASHKNFSRITAMEMGSNDRYLARLVETFFKPLFDRGVAFIEAGIENGDFKKIDPRQLLVAIYAMTMAYFSDAEFIGMLLGEDPLNKKQLNLRRELIIDMVFDALGCERK